MTQQNTSRGRAPGGTTAMRKAVTAAGVASLFTFGIGLVLGWVRVQPEVMVVLFAIAFAATVVSIGWEGER